MFRVSSALPTQAIKAEKLREIRFDVLPDNAQSDKKMLLFTLLAPMHGDIFAVLCEDLIASVADIEQEKELIKVLAQRFEKWQHLFERIGQTGLSENAQKGLFGELWFLYSFLQKSKNQQYAVRSWEGNIGFPQDFVYQNLWAVEVKTTTPNNEYIAISNENQLDTTQYENLFLARICLQSSTKQGISLPELVKKLRDYLQSDMVAYTLFAQKLLNAGYYDLHQVFYETVLYEIDSIDFYHVTGAFPRLEAHLLPKGVSHVKYDITLSACVPFTVSEHHIFNLLNDYE